jgi:hypothetical protein
VRRGDNISWYEATAVIKIGYCGFHVPGSDEKSLFRGENLKTISSFLDAKFIPFETQTMYFPDLHAVGKFLRSHPDFVLGQSQQENPFVIGEIGIWASWYVALSKFVESDLDWLLIFEDDLWMTGPESVELVDLIFSQYLPDDADFVTFNAFEGEFKLYNEDMDVNGYLAHRFQTCNLGLTSVSKRAAREILGKIKSGIDDPIDLYLCSESFKVKAYSLKPHIQAQKISLYNREWIGSTITPDGVEPKYVPFPFPTDI